MTDQRTLAEQDARGRLVREAWVKWAKTQPDPKPSWLVPWEDLGESEREADRCIGDAFADAIEQAEARIAELQKENRELRGGDEISGGLRIPFSDRKQIGQLAKKLRVAEARIATCDQIHDAEQAWRMRLNDRLIKAEQLADAVGELADDCDVIPDVDGSSVAREIHAALAAFRTTEDAK